MSENNENKNIQQELDASMFHLFKEADVRYAQKLVEKIVFGAVGFVALGFLAALVALVWPK